MQYTLHARARHGNTISIPDCFLTSYSCRSSRQLIVYFDQFQRLHHTHSSKPDAAAAAVMPTPDAADIRQLPHSNHVMQPLPPSSTKTPHPNPKKVPSLFSNQAEGAIIITSFCGLLKPHNLTNAKCFTYSPVPHRFADRGTSGALPLFPSAGAAPPVLVLVRMGQHIYSHQKATSLPYLASSSPYRGQPPPDRYGLPP